jgi:hypothetical protein
MTHFTPLESAMGGILIGLASALIFFAGGRIAGISGIVGSLFRPKPGDVDWRIAFILGLVLTGGIAYAIAPSMFAVEVHRSKAALIVAGLLVGFGTRLGNGCTSGHGVCGMARLSNRSFAAVFSFLGAGIATATITRIFFGGVL